MMSGERKTDKLTRKEAFRQYRHQAYLKAKERQKTDPRQLALQAELTRRRKGAYQELRQRRKEALTDQKRLRQERKAERAAKAQAEPEWPPGST